jgi:hypothetical protein
LFIAWAFVLAFKTGVVLWDLTGSLSQFGRPHTTFGWLSLIVTFVAPFGFGISVFGLWGLRPWGRYLFLGLSTLFWGVNLVGIWLTDDLSLNSQSLTPLRNTRWLASVGYGLALIVSLIYFNLSRVKILFACRCASQSGNAPGEPDR